MRTHQIGLSGPSDVASSSSRKFDFLPFRCGRANALIRSQSDEWQSYRDDTMTAAAKFRVLDGLMKSAGRKDIAGQGIGR